MFNFSGKFYILEHIIINLLLCMNITISLTRKGKISITIIVLSSILASSLFTELQVQLLVYRNYDIHDCGIEKNHRLNLTAHIALFLALLGLAHAKQMRKMLEDDIADQDDLGAYYEFRPYNNELSLFSASTLAQVTEFFLYVATAIASIYFGVCLGLFFGVFKSKPCLIVPWLIFGLTWAISRVFLVYYGQDEKFVYIFGGKTQYWAFWTVYTIFDLIIWYVAYAFYTNLREINKLTEIATVAIPCPAPGMAPYHFRRENMHLGSNGYKHILYDTDLENPKI